MKSERVTIIVLVMAILGVFVGGSYLFWRDYSARGRNQKYNEAYQRGETNGPVIPDEIYRMIYEQ